MLHYEEMLTFSKSLKAISGAGRGGEYLSASWLSPCSTKEVYKVLARAGFIRFAQNLGRWMCRSILNFFVLSLLAILL